MGITEVEVMVGRGHGKRRIDTEKVERTKDEAMCRVIKRRKEKTNDKQRRQRNIRERG